MQNTKKCTGVDKTEPQQKVGERKWIQEFGMNLDERVVKRSTRTIRQGGQDKQKRKEKKQKSQNKHKKKETKQKRKLRKEGAT